MTAGVIGSDAEGFDEDLRQSVAESVVGEATVSCSAAAYDDQVSPSLREGSCVGS